MPILQNEFELAMGNGLKLNDTVYIYDARSMNADESHGIKMGGQLVKCGSVQQFFAGDVQIHINSCSFNPVDVGYANEARRSAALTTRRSR